MPLLNLMNIPGGQISGLSDENLQFVSSESAQRYLRELSDEFRKNMEEDHNLPTLTQDQLDYLRTIEESSVPKSTANQTNQHVAKLRTFLRENSLQENFEHIPVKHLNDYLRLFYAQARKKNGDLYAPASLICIRASIQRHLTS